MTEENTAYEVTEQNYLKSLAVLDPIKLRQQHWVKQRDALSMSLNLGYIVDYGHLRHYFYHIRHQPGSKDQNIMHFYWSTIIATTTLGTTIADYVDRTLGLGLFRCAAIENSAYLFYLWRVLAIGSNCGTEYSIFQK